MPSIIENNFRRFIEDQIDLFPLIYRQGGMEALVRAETELKNLEAVYAGPPASRHVGKSEAQLVSKLRETTPKMPFFTEAAIEWLKAGKKIDSIKQYRMDAEKILGFVPGLKDAKDIMEAYGRDNGLNP